MRKPVIKIKKRVFLSWLLSYWSVLLIALLASLLIYSSANKALNVEIEKVEQSVLQSTQNMIDARLAEIRQTASLLQQDQDLRKFAHVIYPFYKTDIALSMAAGKARMLLAADNNLIIDHIYLYSLRSQVTLSTRYGVNDKGGFELPTKALFGLESEQFEEMMTQVIGLPEFLILPPLRTGELQQILLLYPVTGVSARAEGVLVFQLDAASLLQLRAGETRNFNLLIINEDDQLISSETDIPYADNLRYADVDEGSATIRIEQAQYLISATQSRQSSWKYILVANLDVFQGNLRTVRNTMLLFIFSFLLLGTIVSVFLVRRNYSPVSHLMDRVAQLSGKKTGEAANEFQQLESALQDIYKEKESYSKRLDRQRTYMQAVVLNRLLKGRIPTTEQAQEMLASEGIEFRYSHYALVMMTIDDYGLLISSEEDDPAMTEAVELSQVIIKNVLEELFAEQMNAQVFESDNFLTCLISLEPNTQSRVFLEETLRKGLAVIRQYFNLIITAGVSGIHESLIGTARCYQEALEVLEITRALGAPGEITLYDARRASSSKLTQSAMHLETRRLMLNYLLVEDYESAEKIAIDFVSTLELSPPPSAYRRIAQSGLIEDLSAALDSLCGEQECLRHPSAEATLAELLNAELLPDFRRLIQKFFAQLRLIREEKDQLFQNDVKLNQIVDYVEKNINDYNLSVASLARGVNLSVSQVARLMRSKLGQGTLDYIQKRRIERAKKLLIETDLSIVEIARRVGYENFRTMNSIFKKIEGITGTQFRENAGKSGF